MRTAWLGCLALALGPLGCGSSNGSGTSPDVSGGQEVAQEAFVVPDVPPSEEAEVAVLADADQGDSQQPGEAAGTYQTCSALLFDCVFACDEADPACEDDCMTKADPSAATGWDALAQCGEDDCPAEMDLAGWVACFAETCVNEFGACVGGSKKCKDVRGCAAGCAPGDATCLFQCLAQGDDDAKTLFSNLFSCVFIQCGDKTDPLEYQACADSAYNHECTNHLSACEPM